MSRGADGRWELGVVVAYNSATHTSIVRTHGGRPLRDVPQLRATAGGFDHLDTGTTVVISWDLGMPVIVGCMSFPGGPQAAIVPPSVTGVEGYGDSDPTQMTDGFISYKPPTAPTDLGPGDWAQVGNAGNHVAVMAGGVTAVGSPTAHVESFGASGTLKHVARSTQTYTDFGNWKTQNDQGRTSFILRAGSNQSTETGLDEQNWTIKFDLGASGDVLDFVVSDPSGKTLFRLHAGSDGRVQIYGDGGVDVSSGAGGTSEMRSDVGGDRTISIEGSDSLSTSGDSTASVGGSTSVTVGGDARQVVGGALTESAVGDRSCVVGGDDTLAVTGNSTAIVQKTMEVTAGDMTILSRDDVDVGAANTLSASATDVRIDGRSSITLGPSGAHPLPLFDLFLYDMANFLSALMTIVSVVGTIDPVTVGAAQLIMQKFVGDVTAAEPYMSTLVKND